MSLRGALLFLHLHSYKVFNSTWFNSIICSCLHSHRFKVVDLLTMASQHQNAVLDSEQERPMLEGALTFLVILTSLRIHLGKWYNTWCSQCIENNQQLMYNKISSMLLLNEFHFFCTFHLLYYLILRKHEDICQMLYLAEGWTLYQNCWSTRLDSTQQTW